MLLKSPVFCYISESKSPCLMKKLETASPEAYAAPLARVVELSADLSFLASNLEPIDGGDDSYIDW